MGFFSDDHLPPRRSLIWGLLGPGGSQRSSPASTRRDHRFYPAVFTKVLEKITRKLSEILSTSLEFASEIAMTPGPSLSNVTTLATIGIHAMNISVNQSSAISDGRLQNVTQYAPVIYKSLHNNMHKKSTITTLDYEIVNEGYPHEPQFRDTILIGKEEFTSPNTYTQQKAAEQDAATKKRI
nr:uncharacterized protein LOC109151046 [Ipomoea trifida]